MITQIQVQSGQKGGILQWKILSPFFSFVRTDASYRVFKMKIKEDKNQFVLNFKLKKKVSNKAINAESSITDE